MKLIADTNILLRLVLDDDRTQAAIARDVVEGAELVFVPITALCELVWTLRRGYKRPVADIVDLLADILDTDKFVTDRPAAEAGLSVLRGGGDFADGVIAYQGFAMGGTALASFDREAVARVSDCVGPAFIPESP